MQGSPARKVGSMYYADEIYFLYMAPYSCIVKHIFLLVAFLYMKTLPQRSAHVL